MCIWKNPSWWRNSCRIRPLSRQPCEQLESFHEYVASLILHPHYLNVQAHKVFSVSETDSRWAARTRRQIHEVELGEAIGEDFEFEASFTRQHFECWRNLFPMVFICNNCNEKSFMSTHRCRDLLKSLLIRIGTNFPGQSRSGSFTPFLRFDGWNSRSICSRVSTMSSSRYSSCKSSRLSLSSLFCIFFDWYSSSAKWKIQSQNKCAWLNLLKNVPLTTERCNFCRCNLMKADRNDDNFQQRHRERNFMCR